MDFQLSHLLKGTLFLHWSLSATDGSISLDVNSAGLWWHKLNNKSQNLIMVVFQHGSPSKLLWLFWVKHCSTYVRISLSAPTVPPTHTHIFHLLTLSLDGQETGGSKRIHVRFKRVFFPSSGWLSQVLAMHSQSAWHPSELHALSRRGQSRGDLNTAVIKVKGEGPKVPLRREETRGEWGSPSTHTTTGYPSLGRPPPQHWAPDTLGENWFDFIKLTWLIWILLVLQICLHSSYSCVRAITKGIHR